MKTNRFGKISFWKFGFCLLIILFHIASIYPNYRYNFLNGSIGVEFFFLVSGFFLAKKCIYYEPKKSIGEETFDFMKSKIKKFIPYIIILMIIGIPYLTFIKHYTLTEHVMTFYKVLLIPASMNTDPSIYGILWYLTVMILVETVMFPLLTKYKKNFIYIVCPIIVILLMNYILVETKILVAPWTKTPFALKGVLRGFLVMNLGMYLYVLSEKFNNIKLTKLSKFILPIIEISMYLSIFYIANITNAHDKFDIFMLILLSIGLLISANPNAYLTKFSNNKVFYFLEKISLPMYIYQWVVIYGLEVLLRKLGVVANYWVFSLLTILILIFGSIILIYIIKFYEKNKHKLISLFIDTKTELN